MKHELVHRYTCEGCGATFHSADELDEFGHHSRRGLGGYIRNSTADTEAQCKEYRAEEKRWMLERDVDEETRNAAGGALQLIVDGLDAAKREASALRKQAYEQQELRRVAEYRVEQLAKALGIVCSTLRMEGICNGADCGTDACSINPLCETGIPACRAMSEQQADGEESAELDREFHALLEDFDTVRAARDAAEERVKQLAEALRSACTELLTDAHGEGVADG